jgi:hypothetical protein
MKKMLKSKLGISVWISWVLLVAFSVMVGTMVLQWSKSNATQTVDDITEQGEILTLCQETGISITSSCQNTQTLNMNITNNNNRKVDALLIRGFDIYDMPHGGQRNLSIDPEETVEFSIVKQGVLKRAEVVPIIKVGDKRVICQSKRITLDNILLKFCS